MKFKRKLVYGVGVNDSEQPTEYMKDGKRVKCPIYVMWINMFKRCYSEAYLRTHESYRGCYVSDSWRHFTAFRGWVLTKDWEGKQLDKDLLVSDNKEYGPEFCVFVPPRINTLIGIRKAFSNGYPTGVSFDSTSRKFVSGISIEGRRKSLGYFASPENAHKAWQIAKAAQIETEVINYTEGQDFEQIVVDALLLKVIALKEDILENRETISL